MTRPLRILLLGLAEVPAARMPDGVQLHPCADLADALGRAAAGAADALVVSPGVAGLDALVVERLRAAGCRVLALTDGPADEALAGRIGIRRHVGLPLRAEPLLAAWQAAAGDAMPDGAAVRGAAGSAPVVAVWGPPGAPGRTTVTALLAAAASGSGLRVGVVDADLGAPAWSLAGPGTSGRSGLLVAGRRAGTGSHDVSDLLVEVAPRVRALLMAAEPLRWTEIAPPVLPAVVRSVGEHVDLVLVDVGADIRPAHPAYDIGWAHDSAAIARSALAAADSVVAVLSCDPLGVLRFASWWPVLRGCAEPSVVVANRAGRAAAGRRPEQQVAAVLDALECGAPQAAVPWRAAAEVFEPGWERAKGWGAAPARLWGAVRAGLAGLPAAA